MSESARTTSEVDSEESYAPPVRWFRRTEELVGSVILLAMVLVPLAAAVARWLPTPGLAWAEPVVRHLNLWIALLGAALAAREGKLLQLATGRFLPEGLGKSAAACLAAFVGCAVSALLARAGYDLVALEREFGTTFVEDLPLWPVLLVLPIAFALVGLRLAWRAGSSWLARGIAALGLALGTWIGSDPALLEDRAAWPWLALILLATLLGTPLFVALGGSALVLFMVDATPPEAVPSEIYRLASSPFLAAVPLFTLAGFVLTCGAAPQRMVALFRAACGWMPGGTAVVCVVACTFFTAFTGGSGVTILALGGLLYAALSQEGYRDRFSLGLLTGSSSLGLLFPPALPLILYGIAAEVPIEDLFKGGVVPGVVLVALLALYGVFAARRAGVQRTPFSGGALLRAAWAAKFELSIPVVALIAIFGGFATLVEAAALTAFYALVIQVVIHRDVRPGRDLLRVFTECIALLGGVLVILCVAMGLTSWLVDAEIPARLLEWVQGSIESRLLFLLGLNVFLVLVGCFMDVYSATFVVVPLLLPLGAAYGIDPVHLGIIFVANLELGYLTPPVGLNLFVASYRFDRPLLEVYRAAIPMFLILGVGVLLITYVPFFSTWWR